MSDIKLSEAPMKLPSVVTIPRDKWKDIFGYTEDGHCALGWLKFEQTGDHEHFALSRWRPSRELACSRFCLTSPCSRFCWASRVIDANDSRDERRLAELFAEHGIQLRFVGEYKSIAQSSALVPRSAENKVHWYGDQLILGAKV